MGNIVLLDDLTINKIAAGEVIERPASVVKEMVENSIDAGATSIDVEIKNGGISYIRVSDNGKGIEPDDMEIAFERHATSKIRKAEDLETIKSMGFRGEALASIAAIANVEMVSKKAGSEFGYKVVVEAGQVLEKSETGCANGTSITVRNLFFNTPVRYKFLRKDYTESGYIEDAITRLALVHPNISFKLVNSGKTIIQTTGDGDRKNCIYSIFGKDIANGIIDVHYAYDDIVVDGVIGKPEIARNNRSQQMFFVNSRYVKDKTLSSAIEQGYKGMLTVGKHAFCVLNIEMDPGLVDVNVHPAKLEVRFKDENKVFKAIFHTIKENLLKSDLVKHAEEQDELQIIDDKPKSTLFNPIPMSQDNKKVDIGAEFERIAKNYIDDKKSEPKFRNPFKRKREIEYKQEGTNLVEQLYYQKNNNIEPIGNDINLQNNSENNIVEEKENPITSNGIENIIQSTPIEPADTTFIKTSTNTIAEPVTVKEPEEKIEDKPKINIEFVPYPGQELNQNIDFNEMYKKMFGKNTIKEEKAEYSESIKDTKQEVEQTSVFENKQVYVEPTKYRFIGIAFSTYIILEMDNNMYILDQHAAHERIMYEKVKKNFYSDEVKDSQMMLLPDIITLTHKEMDIVNENRRLFERAGFALEDFGDNTIKLVGVPNMCMELDTKELFMEILDAIDTVAITAIQEKEDKFIATVACKAAVKANMALDTQEVKQLMDDLLKLPNPFTCPHGRPTAIQMSKTDIEKKFSRR